MKLAILFLLIICLPCWAVSDEEIKLLRDRIDLLEKNLKNLNDTQEEPKPKVNSYLNNDLTFGGFFDGGLSFLTGPDTETQLSYSSSILGLNISANFDRKLRFVSQFVTILLVNLENPHNDPNASTIGLSKRREFTSAMGVTFPTQSYIEYSMNRKFNIQGGMGYVPFGYVLQIREPVLFVRRAGPHLARSTNVVSPLWTGIHVHGSSKLDSRDAGYNLYTFLPNENTKFLGTGGRVWVASKDEEVIGGLSSQIAKSEAGNYEVLGADVRLDYFPYQVRTEYVHVFERGQDTWTAYIEPGIYVRNEEVFLYVFGDYIYGANNKTTAGRIKLKDPIQKVEYGAGVNWLPTSYTRIRFGLTYGDYLGNTAVKSGVNRDYLVSDLSVGVAF